MLKFKDWYIAKHGAYPGHRGELMADITARLADAFAEYVDEAVAARLPDLGHPTAGWLKGSVDFNELARDDYYRRNGGR